MRRLTQNKHGNLDMVLGGVTIAILLAVSVMIIFNITGSLEVSNTQDRIREGFGYEEWKGVAGDEAANASHAAWNLTQPVTNSSDNLNDNIETFYSITPIVLIVIAAVAILSYVLLLKRT